MARRPPVNPRSGLTSPEGLVSTFTFISSSPTSAAPALAHSKAENVGVGEPMGRSKTHGGQLEVKSWEGRVVFSDTAPVADSYRPLPTQLASSPEERPSLNRPSTPTLGLLTDPVHDLPGATQQQGSSSSPISVSSSSSPERDLPRPRAVPKYTKLSSTAYTSPRLAGPEYRVDLPVIPVSPGDPSGKPVHPFFQRDFQRSRSTPPPPPSQRPRMIATYSSTSQSSQGTSQGTQDTFGSVAGATEEQSGSESPRLARRRGGGTELATHPALRRSYSSGRSDQSEEEEYVEQVGAQSNRHAPKVDEVDAMLADLDLNPLERSTKFIPRHTGAPASTVPPIPPPVRSKTLPNPSSVKPKPVKPAPAPFPLPKSIPKPRSVALPPLAALPPFSKAPAIPIVRAPIYVEDPKEVLPLFRYQDLPFPPKVVYTRDLAEANDVLACLTGKAVAFDMEWPTRTRDKDTQKWVYGQAKTALMQFSDEKLVVLVHVWHMSEIPSKAIEILQNKEVYKLGVQVRGDGLKLIRDYPGVFPEGISSLLELSSMARAADPIGTGPGKTMIGLARLVRWCTGKKLQKGDVRTGDWSKKLDQQQVEYAANDVVSSVEVFNELQRKAKASGIQLDLDRYCGSTGVPQTKNVGAVVDPQSLPSDEMYGQPPVPMPPRQWRAFNIFKDGKSVATMAGELEIKPATCYGYIARAIFKLPSEALSIEQKERFLAEMPETAFIYSDMKAMFKRMQEDVLRGGREGTSEAQA